MIYISFLPRAWPLLEAKASKMEAFQNVQLASAGLTGLALASCPAARADFPRFGLLS
jgi:hypothetical protein